MRAALCAALQRGNGMIAVNFIVGSAHAASEGDANVSGEASQAAGETHAVTETGHGGGEGVFPPFDPTSFASQLLWLAVTFGAFYLLMSRVIIPRIASIIEVRRDRISRDLDEAQRLKEDSDAALAAYEHELAAARASAQAIANKASEQARADSEAERSRLEEQLAGRLAEAEERISAIRAKALAEVDRIAAETAGTIVSELVGIKTVQPEVAAAVAAVART
jgi:F-type H+-transporting ATPase subunit b